MGLDLLYEHDRQRIAGYQTRIDELLAEEADILEALKCTDGDGLDMLLIKIRAHEALGTRLLEQIRSDSRGLSGEYLTATGVYEATVESILARFLKLREMTAEAAEAFDTAGATGAAAERIEALRAFAKKL